MNKQNLIFLIVGLVDSDGCITWSWEKDRTFVPTVALTQKTNKGILPYLKSYFNEFLIIGGNCLICKSKKNLVKFFDPFFYENKEDLTSCRLITSKRADAHLMLFVMYQTSFSKKEFNDYSVRAFLNALRDCLHFGNTKDQHLTLQQREDRLSLPKGLSMASMPLAKNLATICEFEFVENNANLEFLLTNCQPGQTFINPWQVLGFFLGDGGVHLIWGTSSITVTLNFSGDKISATALEAYAACLLQDNVRRKAWRSPKKNASRIIVHGVKTFNDHAIPFFQTYQAPLCEKKEILDKTIKAAKVLKQLKSTLENGKTWSVSEKKDLQEILKETWDLNPSGPSRKFKDVDVYYNHVLNFVANGKMKIR